MDKVGILTFHAAHNYGSMLQAYAIKSAIASLGYDSEIINYRNERQKKVIQHPFCRHKDTGR